MKKFIVSVLAFAAMAFSANAQLYVGGLVGLDLNAPKASTSFSFFLSPEVGYNFSDKFAAGVALSINPQVTSSEGTSNSSFSWSIQPYARFKFLNIGKVRFFGDAGIALGTVGYSYKYENTTHTNDALFQWRVGFYPGIAYDINKKWSVVTHLAGISYGGTKNNNAFDLNLLHNVSIGFYYSF